MQINALPAAAAAQAALLTQPPGTPDQLSGSAANLPSLVSEKATATSVKVSASAAKKSSRPKGALPVEVRTLTFTDHCSAYPYYNSMTLYSAGTVVAYSGHVWTARIESVGQAPGSGWGGYSPTVEITAAKVRKIFHGTEEGMGRFLDTSLGSMNIQIDTAAQMLGYNIENLTSEQVGSIIKSIKNPVEAIFIATGYVAYLEKQYVHGRRIPLGPVDWANIASKYNGSSPSAVEYGRWVVRNRSTFEKIMQ